MQQSGGVDDGTRSCERKRKRWDMGPDGEEMPLPALTPLERSWRPNGYTAALLSPATAFAPSKQTCPRVFLVCEAAAVQQTLVRCLACEGRKGCKPFGARTLALHAQGKAHQKAMKHWPGGLQPAPQGAAVLSLQQALTATEPLGAQVSAHASASRVP